MMQTEIVFDEQSFRRDSDDLHLVHRISPLILLATRGVLRSPRQLQTNHDYAVPTRGYYSDQPSQSPLFLSPVVRGDMPDTWIHGINSMPQESALAHRARPAICTAEALNTLTNIWMGRPLQSAKIAQAYENSLLCGEHTWGMNTQLFGARVYGADWEKARSAGLYADWAASWKDKGEYAVKVDKAAREILDGDFAPLIPVFKSFPPTTVNISSIVALTRLRRLPDVTPESLDPAPA